MNRRHQSGATMWGWLGIIGMIGFIAMQAFAVVPLYYEHSIIRSAVQDIVNEREFNNMPNKTVINTISKRLIINNVRGMDLKAFKTTRDRSGEKYIVLQYEKKASIISNLSAVVEFNEEIRPGN